MSNHVHLVLHVDVLKAQGWSDKQVLALWHIVYKGTLLTQKFMRDETLRQDGQNPRNLRPYQYSTSYQCC
jgi:hypothetical protein